MVSGLVDISETVTVLRPIEIGRDALNVPVVEWISEPVHGVICQPMKNSLMMDRPDETRLVYTLHFPKGYGLSLKGCHVVVRGEELDVDGDPRPHPWSPLNWNMTVGVTRIDG